MRNLPEWVMAFWASIAAGAVAVPLNAWWTGAELAYGLSDSGTSVVFVDEERLGRITPHVDELGELRAVIACSEEADPAGGRRRSEATTLGRQAGPLPVVPFAELVGPATETHAPRGGHRARRRRHHLLHLGHHRAAQGGGRDPPQQHLQPDEPVLRGDRGHTSPGRRLRAGAGRGRPERQPVVGAAVPRHRVPRRPRLQHRRRRQAGHDAPLRSRAGPRAHRARTDHHLRRSAGHGDAGDRLAGLRHPRHIVGAVDLLRRCALSARPGPPDQGALPGGRPRQRLRADRDVGHDHDERRRRLRAQARQRRSARPGLRRGGGARGLRGHRAARRTRRPTPNGPESCGSRARTSCGAIGSGLRRRPPRSPPAGCTPGTWPASTRRGSSTSWTGPRT